MLRANFRANFGDLSLGFDVKAPIPQGLTGSPNYFGLLNNLMTLNICESLREIGEMACVTSAWSSRGQTLKGSLANWWLVVNDFRVNLAVLLTLRQDYKSDTGKQLRQAIKLESV